MIEAKDHNSFVFGDKKLKNIKELIEVLENKDLENIAKTHVTPEKNDFANWIKVVLQNEALAYNLSQETDINNILSILKKEQESLEIKKVAETRVEELFKGPILEDKKDAAKTDTIKKDFKDETVTTDEARLKQETQKSKTVLSHSEPRHFCPQFFNCSRKEFFFGFALGIILGIIIAITVKIGAI